MTDEELAAYLVIPLSVVPKIEPMRRVTYERMAQVAHDLWLWQHDLGPKPEGVIVCREHRSRS